jgi:hypothetical protein
MSDTTKRRRMLCSSPVCLVVGVIHESRVWVVRSSLRSSAPPRHPLTQPPSRLASLFAARRPEGIRVRDRGACLSRPNALFVPAQFGARQ